MYMYIKIAYINKNAKYIIANKNILLILLIRLKQFNLYPLADGDQCQSFKKLTEIHITLYYW